MVKARIFLLCACVIVASLARVMRADEPQRKAGDDVNSQDVRNRQGLVPNENLLFNGWGMTPAGQHVPISDLALKLIVSPDKTRLVAVTGGFNNEGITLLDIEKRTVMQHLAMPEAWNGLAFSNDGKKLFVAGGDKGTIHVFNYADGTAAADHVQKVLDAAGGHAFITGIAVHPTTGNLFVCNEANHELLVLDGQTLAVLAKVGV